MDKFNIRDIRLISILIFILLVFGLAVNHAFQYLPEKTSVTENETIIETPSEEEIQKEEKEIVVEETVSIPKKRKFEVIKDEAEEISEFPENNLVSIEEDERSKDTELGSGNITVDADKDFKNKQYNEALEKYKKIAEQNADNSIKAYCYEKIANIHAIQKHYGSALVFTQKAYNIAPSTSLEILLARLYYKTGDIDKATSRINRVLQRDFANEG